MIEETGCNPEGADPHRRVRGQPGMSVERINLYCGRVDADEADGVHGLEHEG